MRIKTLTAAAGCAAAIAAFGAAPAFAGEVSGNGQPTAAPSHTKSICAYSGLNDVITPDEPGRTQSYGQIVAAGGKAFVPGPGMACNGHTGFLAGGGAE
jgi:hypothetical protein